MKRLIISAIIIMVLVISCLLNQTAWDPGYFSGEWYSIQDQSVYLFEEGILYCRHRSVPVSSTEFISGAYSVSRKSVFLFAGGIDGLEQSRELYLVENDTESFLCENKDGSGQIFFVRDHRNK